MPTIELVIDPRSQDLGGFSVRRLLPYARRRHVGPFVFLDHMGPAQFGPGHGIDVRPHPHIGLATVTYLFEGSITHRDSLGTLQDIRPGDVNWMNAGRGIVHSERTPPALRESGSPLHGLQMWVALPLAAEDSTPAFQHHPAATLPSFQQEGATLRLIAGTLYGRQSPVQTASPLFYAEARLPAGASLQLSDEHAERAVYVVSGTVEIDGEPLPAGRLAVLAPGGQPTLRASGDSLLMLLGGPPLDGERLLWWNFVASTPERIEAAQRRWQAQAFDKVPGETEFIPLPEDWLKLPRPR
ncbi:MAG: pirin family protein [Nevskiaceae bacterium]|nr:MAG: pirin family protein [Nevskiaceae bacterium]